MHDKRDIHHHHHMRRASKDTHTGKSIWGDLEEKRKGCNRDTATLALHRSLATLCDSVGDKG